MLRNLERHVRAYQHPRIRLVVLGRFFQPVQRGRMTLRKPRTTKQIALSQRKLRDRLAGTGRTDDQ